MTSGVRELLERIVQETSDGVDVLVVVSRDAANAGKLVVVGDELVYYASPDIPEGMVNGELVKKFTQVLRVPSSRIEIVYGVRGNVKRVRVREVDKEYVVEMLGRSLEGAASN